MTLRYEIGEKVHHAVYGFGKTAHVNAVTDDIIALFQEAMTSDEAMLRVFQDVQGIPYKPDAQGLGADWYDQSLADMKRTIAAALDAVLGEQP